MISTINPQKLLKKTKARLKNYLVQEIPGTLSACEFDCHQQHCTYGQAMECQKRQILLNLAGQKP